MGCTFNTKVVRLPDFFGWSSLPVAAVVRALLEEAFVRLLRRDQPDRNGGTACDGGRTDDRC